jgi:4-hydroxybenzoate polyprenyltransferase
LWIEKWYTQIHDWLETSLKKTLKGLAKLTRFSDYGYYVIVPTLLGIAAAKGMFSWQLLLVLMANWMAVGFAYMVDDIEDAPDDALSVTRVNRNPISSGLIAPKTARIAMLTMGVSAAVVFAVLGIWPFIFGMISLTFGYLYSVKYVQLKSITYFDIVIRSLLLSGLPFLCGYFSFTSRLNRVWYWPFVFLVAIHIYLQLKRDVNDLSSASRTKKSRTVRHLGERSVTSLMIAMAILGAFTGIVTFFLTDVVPSWVVLLMAILAVLFILPVWIKHRREDAELATEVFWRSAVERAAALALCLYFLLPWLNQVFQLWWM